MRTIIGGLVTVGLLALFPGCSGPAVDGTTQESSLETGGAAGAEMGSHVPQEIEGKDMGKLTEGPLSPTGPPLRFTALVEVAPLSPPGSKLADEDGVWLIREDGERWLAPGLDGTQWDGKRVTVTGRVLQPEPGVQVAMLGATYFDVDQVSEAEGDSETSHGSEVDNEASAYEPTYEEPQTFMAIVEIDDTVGSKRFQGVWLVVEGTDERLLVAYRPSNWSGPEEGTRVKVTGRKYQNSPYVQQIVGAQHFAVDEIEIVE